MNKKSVSDRARIAGCLIEGNSIRATVRMTGAAKNTVARLLVDLGWACARFQDAMLRNLPCKRLQCDEIWAFCYAKQKNVPKDKRGKFGYGDVWTWTAICADTKLIPTWLVGPRNTRTATAFMKDLASRLVHRVQLTTDGHKPYLQAVEDAFGSEIDYATLEKLYGSDPESEHRYSPTVVLAVQDITVQGNPDPDHVSTSYAERQNLTMRMSMRRFTRLTNAFSKKVQSLEAAVSLHFMWYNFGRIHQSLRVTPAMAAGVAKRPWTLEDVVGLLDRKNLQAN